MYTMHCFICRGNGEHLRKARLFWREFFLPALFPFFQKQMANLLASKPKQVKSQLQEDGTRVWKGDNPTDG